MRKGYPYIDGMRIIAAILVVAIHIYPFAQIDPTLDFMMTRIIGRLAVPFFFITTSFFLFKNGYPTPDKIKKTLLELLKWYGISIIIYIPLMIYNQYFIQDNLTFELMKDLLIDGTFYHLWYFPAVIIGLIIVLFLIRYLSSYALFITMILYVIGLCGDSYFGLVTQVDFVNQFVTGLFSYMDYTRNGFFFAPLFIMIGHKLAYQKHHLKGYISFIFFLITFVMMSFESQFVHMMDFVKHDAMYVMLPIVSYFLFSLLISYHGERHENYKNISLWVYIIHPSMIVVVRMMGKFLNCTPFIENNFIQFLSVLFYSFLFAWIMNHLMKGRNV